MLDAVYRVMSAWYLVKWFTVAYRKDIFLASWISPSGPLEVLHPSRIIFGLQCVKALRCFHLNCASSLCVHTQSCVGISLQYPLQVPKRGWKGCMLRAMCGGMPKGNQGPGVPCSLLRAGVNGRDICYPQQGETNRRKRTA